MTTVGVEGLKVKKEHQLMQTDRAPTGTVHFVGILTSHHFFLTIKTGKTGNRVQKK